MTKTELKRLAKEVLMENLAVAYYCLENSKYDDLTDEEREQLFALINKYGTAMGKAIGEKYYTF